MKKHQKVLISALLLVSAAAIAGEGLHATFTSTLNAGPQSISTATLTLVAGATNQFEGTVTGIVPGDTIESAIDLENTSTPSTALGSVSFSVTAGTSSLLDSTASTSGGLTLGIQSCSVAWTPTLLGDGGHSYTCSGSLTQVMATTDVLTLKTTPGNLTPLPAAFISTGGAGNEVHLMQTVTFPSLAPNTYEGLTSVLTYVFTGNQRAAASE